MRTKSVLSDAEFFEQTGFCQEPGFGLRPTLLLVEMIKAFTNPDVALGADFES
jgi:maleamate amidohydrolase